MKFIKIIFGILAGLCALANCLYLTLFVIRGSHFSSIVVRLLGFLIGVAICIALLKSAFKKKKEVTTHTLFGSSNLERRTALITELLSNAENKSERLAELRLKNMNYALLTFAGLFTVSLGLLESNKLYSLLASVALFVMMIIFCCWDYRVHKHVHGWRLTRKVFVKLLTELINHPTKDATFLRYRKEGEKKAEPFSLQPCIYYLLVTGGFGHLLFFLPNVASN